MNANGADGAAEAGDGPTRVTIGAQYVKDLSFESPNAPKSLGNVETRPEIGLDLNVEARPLQERVYEVVLHLSVRAGNDENTLFVVELAYGAVASLPELPDEVRSRIVGSEVPRLMFPFARAVVANAVRDGGFPPFLIDPIDFDALYLRAAGAAQAEANA